MPHLSPMNWTLAILLFWSFTFLLSSLMFFQDAPKFSSPKYSLKSSLTQLWKWSLQDGRA